MRSGMDEVENEVLLETGASQGGNGFKAEFWHSVHNLHNVNQAKSAVGRIRATHRSTVSRIDYRSTGGHWSGLNNSYRDNWVAKFEGYLKITKSGTYRFYTNSDDGSFLYIDNHLVVNNDGLHGMRTKHGTRSLKQGTQYKVTVWFFERGGGAGLHVHWSGP